MPSLLESFEARFGPVPPTERDRVAAVLAELDRRGRAAWPELAVPAAAVAGCVAECVLATADVVAAIEALPPDDAYLAAGCAVGAQPALVAFEHLYFGGAREALRRMGRDAASIEDFMQRVRERLFVAPPAEMPRICALIGGGDLGALIRIAAVRLALNAGRDDHRADGDPDPLLAQLASEQDPEAELIDAEARAEVKRAFTDALGALTARDRTLLKLHLVHGLSIDDIGATFQVHRATAARWLARIRSDLEEGTLHRLRARLQASDAGLASLVRAVRSRLDISFSRVLAT